MSRRKQSKPQHVEFPDNKTPLSTSLVCEPNPAEQLAREEQLDAKESTATNGPKADSEVDDNNNTGVRDATNGLSIETSTVGKDTTCFEHCEAQKSAHCFENEREIHMASRNGNREDFDSYQDFSPGSPSHKHGQFPSSHRSVLYPRYNGSFATQKQGAWIESSPVYTKDKENQESRGDKLENQDRETVTTSIANADEKRPRQENENGDDMHTCSRCNRSFENLRDYMRHQDFECEDRSVGANMASTEQGENESNQCSEVSDSNTSYVISGNVIMASEEDLIAQRRRTIDDEERELNIDEDRCMEETSSNSPTALEGTSGMENPPRISNENYPEGRSGSPGSIAESESNSEKLDEPFISDSIRERCSTNDDDDQNKDLSTNDADKLRKEIMATEAMAHAIQNMTAFASQNNNANADRPDISAIKYQVRMIQQQQAYQVQMLNFLQWQLAIASTNPQAAMAAAASNCPPALSNGFPVNGAGMQSPFMHGAPGMPGGAFMPQMMAAMAMNNFQSAAGENNGMAELAKARLMMGMQHASTDGNQAFRNLFPQSFNEQDEGQRNGHEQRYQLKVATDEDGGETKFDDGQAKEDGNGPPKSDSGYSGDDRFSNPSNGQNADDTSSSHGSQEDGELRDSALKATAEEHRHRCRFCHKIFGSDSALQIHIRSHTGERPFKCNICGNRFTTKGNLKVHFTRHKSKYPHIPMNGQPVPEYLDHVPTSNGVPYGMSILPEKAALERPRLHGNPSIHLSPQQAALLNQRESGTPGQGFPGLFNPHLSALAGKSENDLLRGERSDADITNTVGASDVATAIQAQLLHRRRAELMDSQWANEESKKADLLDSAESKNPMSLLQAAMLPFLPGIAARQQLENVPPHLRYLLPQQFGALQNPAASSAPTDSTNGNSHMDMRLPTLPKSSSPQMNHGLKQELPIIDKMTSSRPQTSSSETTKLQRLVENIDRGRVLQKNECHMCHRILSCQSALKLHYRTHTGERPYKCDLCSRAFTTRGNLRTHYSSVHRQQMRPIPPSNSRSSNSETFTCTLCPARFRDTIEFQRHMQMHAMVQAQQQQQRMLAAEIESDKHRESLRESVETNQDNADINETSTREESVAVKSEQSLNQITTQEREENGAEEMEKDDSRQSSSPQSTAEEALVNRSRLDSDKLDQPSSPMDGNRSPGRESLSRQSPPATANPLDSLAALSNITAGSDVSGHTGSMLDHQLAALSRARAGRLTVCEICEKPFSCQSALEIHIRTHTKERPFICQICQRAFTTKGNLKQHLLTHNITDIPDQMLMPASSPKNGNSASTTPSSSPTPSDSQNSLTLKRGSDSVDQSEPPAKRTFPRHWCHICQKQFSSASSLQIHNRTHTGEKPFACNVCGRAFTTKGNLKVHMGTHVWGAGGSRRGRRISMDNPLISPWMKNMTRAQPAQPAMPLPPGGPVADPTAALYQQYAALARGILSAKQDAASRFMMPMTNGQNGNSASSPVSSNGSPHPTELGSPKNRVNGANVTNPTMSAATEWFLKAYQRTQEQVN